MPPFLFIPTFFKQQQRICVFHRAKDSCDFIMTLDIEEYMKDLDEFNWSDEKKEEIIRSIWLMMESIVDQAFGIHPIQLARKKSGNNDLQSPAKQIKSITSPLNNSFSNNSVSQTDNAEVTNHDNK